MVNKAKLSSLFHKLPLEANSFSYVRFSNGRIKTRNFLIMMLQSLIILRTCRVTRVPRMGNTTHTLLTIDGARTYNLLIMTHLLVIVIPTFNFTPVPCVGITALTPVAVVGPRAYSFVHTWIRFAGVNKNCKITFHISLIPKYWVVKQ